MSRPIETIQKPCPVCSATFVSRDPTACHTWHDSTGWKTCPSCDSAVLYSCPCGWRHLNGMNPRNPGHDANLASRPDWMPSLEQDIPELPDLFGPDDVPAVPGGRFPLDGQTYSDGTSRWNVARLVDLSRNKPIVMKPVGSLIDWMGWSWETDLDLEGFFRLVQRVRDADLRHPILLSPDGWIMDGVHRLVKARLEGRGLIATVQFDEMPEPDQ